MKKNIQDYLYSNIPITEPMGVIVKLATPQKVMISAPFANNINHKQTVFGGSLHAVATLACWSMVYMHLKDLKGVKVQIVITESHANYISPVDDDFTAVCASPEQSVWDRFIKILQAKGKSRIQLSATVHHRGRLAIEFHATFAAIEVK